MQVNAFRASGGKGWMAYCEPGGTVIDPYHGEIPRLVSQYGKTREEAIAKVERILNA